mmetsp:Transcript_115072/g.365604  ORF Transcript_115072/g.365604 Transcript_115072/m.365604 type:complete len:372 (+) Transcript_115072:330-1445(+)
MSFQPSASFEDYSGGSITPLESALAVPESRNYGTTGKKPACNRRQTFHHDEQLYINKRTTWPIEVSKATMHDVSLVINMLADLSPTGLLPLSFGMIGTGYVPALALLLVFASAAAFMMCLIGRTIEITGEKTFDRMWAKVVGPSTVWVPTFTVFLVTFGCCLAYACMFGDLFAGCMPAFGVTFASRTVCLLVLSSFPLLPLCLLKDLSALAPTSLCSLIAVVFTVFMMATRYRDGSYLEGGQYFNQEPPPAGHHIMSIGPSSLLLVNGLAVVFLCHYNGCKYYREYGDHRPDRFGRKVLLVFSIVSMLFACGMMLGYATFGGLSDGVILNSYAQNDMFANLSRLGMGLANVLSFPLVFGGLCEQSLALMSS